MANVRMTVACAFILCAVVSAGNLFELPDDQQPKSVQARGVLARYENALTDAKTTYDAAVASAVKQAIDDLTKARAEVMKSGGQAGLDEANRIQSAIDKLKEQAAPTRDQKFTIHAARGWQPTLTVVAGRTYKIRASGKWVADKEKPGEWTMGPDVVQREGRSFGLFGKIGNGNVFAVGDTMTLVPEAEGMLSLQLMGGEVKNDAGAVSVSVGSAP